MVSAESPEAGATATLSPAIQLVQPGRLTSARLEGTLRLAGPPGITDGSYPKARQRYGYAGKTAKGAWPTPPSIPHGTARTAAWGWDSHPPGTLGKPWDNRKLPGDDPSDIWQEEEGPVELRQGCPNALEFLGPWNDTHLFILPAESESEFRFCHSKPRCPLKFKISRLQKDTSHMLLNRRQLRSLQNTPCWVRYCFWSKT